MFRPLVASLLVVMATAGAVAYLLAARSQRKDQGFDSTRFEPLRRHIAAACLDAQRASRITVLCPTELPVNATTTRNCQPPAPAAVQLLHDGPRTSGIDVQSSSLHFGILGPGFPGVEKPLKGWSDLGLERLGGRSGHLYFSPPEGMAYHSGHLVFRFRHKGEAYAASLHANSEGWTSTDVELLADLTTALRPASELEIPRGVSRGEQGSRPVGDSVRIFDVSDVVSGQGRAWAVSYANSQVHPIRRGELGEPLRVPANPLEGALVHDHRLWVASSGADTVTAIGVRSSKLLVTVEVGDSPEDLAVLNGSLWVLNVLDGTVSRVDATSGEVEGRPFHIPGRPVALDAGFGRLWLADCSQGELLAVDPASGRITSRTKVGSGLNDVLPFDGTVWVSDWSAGTVLRIDPASGRIVERIAAGETPGELAGGRSGLWVADPAGAAILRLDPHSNRLVETVRVGEAPTSLAVGTRIVWVVDRNRVFRVRAGSE